MNFFTQRLQPRLVIGGTLCALLCTIAVFGPLFVSKELGIQLAYDLAPPSTDHFLGAGENGIDVLTWLLFGARASLFISLTCTLICLCIGVLFGATAGLIGGRTEQLMMRLTDVFLAFPGLLLAIYISSVFFGSMSTLIFALCATSWITFARLARAQVLELKEREFVLASHALGASKWRIIRKDILPNIASPLLVQTSFTAAGILLTESALSFLGLGLPPGTPSLGALLDQGVANILVAPHIAISASASIALFVIGFQIFGEGLRDALDLRL